MAKYRSFFDLQNWENFEKLENLQNWENFGEFDKRLQIILIKFTIYVNKYARLRACVGYMAIQSCTYSKRISYFMHLVNLFFSLSIPIASLSKSCDSLPKFYFVDVSLA